MSRTVELQLSDLVFPNHCAACTQSAQGGEEIEFKRGLDLLVISFLKTTSIKIPVCKACRAKWWKRYVLFVVGIVMAVVALVGLYAWLFHDTYGEQGLVLLIPPVLILIVWSRRKLASWVDRAVYGIRIESYDWNTSRARVWLRDEALASELENGLAQGLDAQHRHGRGLGVGGAEIEFDAETSKPASTKEPDAAEPSSTADLVWLNRRSGKGLVRCKQALEQAQGDRQLAVQMLMSDEELARESNALIARDIVSANLQGPARSEEWEVVEKAQERKQADDELREWVDEDREN